MIGKLKRTEKCRACGKDIAFIKTVSGKCIPVDPVPVEFMLYEENERFITEDGEVKDGEEIAYDKGFHMGNVIGIESLTGYRDHRKTCKAAEDLKRKKNKSERVK